MKIINKTKKYLHVRVTKEEFVLLETAIADLEDEKKQEQKRLEYAEWFYTNHIDISQQDEYSSWHTYWKNINSGKSASEPDMFIRTYKHRFADIIKKNKKRLGYKD